MTPKEEYDTRKKLRQIAHERHERYKDDDEMALVLLERMAGALENIASFLEEISMNTRREQP